MRAFYPESERDYLPAAILAKKKHCFQHPAGEWLATPTPLRETVTEALPSLAHRGIVREVFIAALLDDSRTMMVHGLTALAWYMAVLEL